MISFTKVTQCFLDRKWIPALPVEPEVAGARELLRAREGRA